MRLRLALPLITLALGGCELVKNTGEVCVVPKDAMCACYYGDTGDDTDGELCGFGDFPYWDSTPPSAYGCQGEYPANTAFQLHGFLYEGGQGYSVKEKCKVEVEGKRIVVKTRFWHEPEQDAIREPPAVATCEVPPLSAGTYTLEFNGGEAEFEVGTDEVQPMACAESQDQHTP